MSPQAAAPKRSAEEVTREYVAAKFDEAWELQEEYAELLKRRTALRQQLTNEKALGHFSEEQTEEYNDLFPPRTKLTAEQREERLERDLEKVRKRREEAAKKATGASA